MVGSVEYRGSSWRRSYDSHNHKIEGLISHTVRLVVVSLDKILPDNYSCLVESNEQQIKEVKRKIQPKNSETMATREESGYVLRTAPTVA